MTWIEYHRQSEGFASEAEIAVRSRQHSRALQLYAKAAQAEETALQYVEPSKQRTYGITAVSAVSLYFKASQYDLARNFAYRCLGSGRLPAFAIQQIDELLDSIKIEQAGVGLNGARILLSLAGGDLIPGGAPLDLVIAKAQKMKALLYRTTEYLKKIPHRRRGEPENTSRTHTGLGYFRPLQAAINSLFLYKKSSNSVFLIMTVLAPMKSSVGSSVSYEPAPNLQRANSQKS